jgi:putative transcriptional regulator
MRYLNVFYILVVLKQKLIMNRIKEVLEEKGIKQTWLAEKLGKSYNMVNAYVQNRQQPRLEILYEIAGILDVEVKDLLIEVKKDK